MALVFRAKKIGESNWNFTPDGFKILESTDGQFRIMEIDKMNNKPVKMFYRTLINRGRTKPAWFILKDKIPTLKLAKKVCEDNA